MVEVNLATAADATLDKAGPNSWEALAQTIGAIWPQAQAFNRRAVQGGLAIGALIIRFSELSNVRAEMNAANTGRPGRKFEPIGFVAQKLTEEFGARVPSLKHLRDCARAAAVAHEGGTLKGGMRALLGWDKEEILAPDAVQITLPKGATNADARKARKSYGQIYVQNLNGICAHAQAILGFPGKQKLDETDWDNIEEALGKINSYLRQLSLEIVQFKKANKK